MGIDHRDVRDLMADLLDRPVPAHEDPAATVAEVRARVLPRLRRAPADGDGQGVEYVVHSGWLCEVVDHHTCGAGDAYGHEPGCGLVPVARVADLLAAHDDHTLSSP